MIQLKQFESNLNGESNDSIDLSGKIAPGK